MFSNYVGLWYSGMYGVPLREVCSRVPWILLKHSISCVVCVYCDWDWAWERKFHVTFVPENESSVTFSLPGAKVPRHFRSRERKFHDIFVLGSESSIPGTFVPGNESSWERKFLLKTDTVDSFGTSLQHTIRYDTKIDASRAIWQRLFNIDQVTK